MPVAFPSIAISRSSSKTTRPVLLRFQAGNGIEHRIVDGARSSFDFWNVVFENVTAAQRTTILTWIGTLTTGDYTT